MTLIVHSWKTLTELWKTALPETIPDSGALLTVFVLNGGDMAVTGFDLKVNAAWQKAEKALVKTVMEEMEIPPRVAKLLKAFIENRLVVLSSQSEYDAELETGLVVDSEEKVKTVQGLLGDLSEADQFSLQLRNLVLTHRLAIAETRYHTKLQAAQKDAEEKVETARKNAEDSRENEEAAWRLTCVSAVTLFIAFCVWFGWVMHRCDVANSISKQWQQHTRHGLPNAVKKQRQQPKPQIQKNFRHIPMTMSNWKNRPS